MLTPENRIEWHVACEPRVVQTIIYVRIIIIIRVIATWFGKKRKKYRLRYNGKSTTMKCDG